MVAINDNLDQLTTLQLAKLALDRGLRVKGSREMLLKRLRLDTQPRQLLLRKTGLSLPDTLR